MTEADKRFYTRIIVTVLAVGVVLLLVKVLFFWPSQERGLPSSTPYVTMKEGPRAPAGPAGVISWQDAANHYGESCTVEGTIVTTHNSGKACFLNFHPNWKKYFTAVIFANRFSDFPPNPEDYYRGKRARVTGYIKEYQGKPEIILESPKQIEIVE